VYNYGTPWYGSPYASGVTLDGPVTGIAAGNVYNYGTPFYGSPHASGTHLTAPIAAATTAPGRGYTLVTASGTLYTY